MDNKTRNELYLKQPTVFGDSRFAPKDFRCWFCNRDILEDKETLDYAKNGKMITGCPFCHISYCD